MINSRGRHNPPSCKASENKAGFTAIEFVVTLAIIMLIGGQVFISFSGLGQGVALNRAVQELVGEIRRAQYGALAVVYAPQAGIPPSPAVGLRISIGTTPSVLRFIDRNDSACTPAPCVQNGKYDSIQNEKIGEYLFPDNIRISRVLDDQGNSYTAAHILFEVPEASIQFTRDDGTAFPGNRMDIELASPTGAHKTVTTRVTGQINAR